MALVGAAALFLASPAGAVCSGDEFQVNTFTTDIQWRPAMAADANGNLVVVWESYGQDGDGSGIFGQRFDSNCAPVGSEFQVNTLMTGHQWNPAVAMDADGDFVVVWESREPDYPYHMDVFGQRYDVNGVPQGGEFRVNTMVGLWQFEPTVAMNPDGDFVVAWSKNLGNEVEVFAQRYDANGTPQGSEFQVNTYTLLGQYLPSVAMDASGNFVVVWRSQLSAANEDGIFGQRYDASGIPQGGEFQVNSDATGFVDYPSVAMDADGDFVVVWVNHNEDWSWSPISAQRFDSRGTPQGGQVQVNGSISEGGWPFAIAMNANGDFAVVWHSFGGEFGAFARRFHADGTPQGSEFQLTRTPTAWTGGLAVGPMDNAGNFAAAWGSFEADWTDPRVLARSFPPNPTLTVAKTGNGDGTVMSDPRGVDCGSDCEETYPAGSVVRLTASADAGSFFYFIGWTGGGCSGTDPCTVALGSDEPITARFDFLDGEFRGRVQGVGKIPIAGATITASQGGIPQGSTTTDLSGDYSLRLTAGTYDLVASHAGYLDAATTLTVSHAQALTGVNFKLYRPSFFQGTVTEKGTGTPLEGALVEALNDGVVVASTTTAADGSYGLQVTKGTYKLRATLAGYSTRKKRDLRIGDGVTRSGVNFALAPAL